MKRFKVGDLARLVCTGGNDLLQPYLGTVVTILTIPGICHCEPCVIGSIVFGKKPTELDYSVQLQDVHTTIVNDPWLTPLGDPDAASDEFDARENEQKEDERDTV